jgi:hypothetical protein
VDAMLASAAMIDFIFMGVLRWWRCTLCSDKRGDDSSALYEMQRSEGTGKIATERDSTVRFQLKGVRWHWHLQPRIV